MDLTEYNEVKRTKVLVYGEPKSGKTATVGKLAEAGFTLHWFDMENGVKTLMNPEMVKPEFRKNIKLYNIPDHRELPIAVDVLRKLFRGGPRKYCFAHGIDRCPVCAKTAGLPWSDEIDIAKLGDKDIIVIDSWTQVANSTINKVTLKEYKKDDEYKPTWDDWRLQGTYLDEVLSKIQVANLNICVISHDVDVEKDEKKEKIVPAGGTRNFSRTMAKYFDEVIYMQRMNKQHKAYSSTTWNNTHLTGGRSGVQLESSADLSLADIFLGKKTG
jgi:hypothetical protein